MKNLNLIIKVITYFFIMFSISKLTYADNFKHCTAYITNQSDEPWVVAFHGNKGGGNVDFINVSNSLCQDGNSKRLHGPCIIQPHTKVTIHFTKTALYMAGDYTVTDHNGLSYKGSYDTATNPKTGIHAWCPHYSNSGLKSDSVYASTEASGDIELLKDSFKDGCLESDTYCPY